MVTIESQKRVRNNPSFFLNLYINYFFPLTLLKLFLKTKFFSNFYHFAILKLKTENINHEETKKKKKRKVKPRTFSIPEWSPSPVLTKPSLA